MVKTVLNVGSEVPLRLMNMSQSHMKLNKGELLASATTLKGQDATETREYQVQQLQQKGKEGTNDKPKHLEELYQDACLESKDNQTRKG